MSAMDEEATQPATQPLPVHNGVAPSTVHGNYLAGVLCLLHPSSPAAYSIVEKTAKVDPGVVLRIPAAQVGRQSTTPEPGQHEEDEEDEEEQQTQLAPNQQGEPEVSGLDIALRLSPGPKDPELGFVFGRNPARCDVVFSESNKSRRISNLHFRIYQNAQGVLMLHDSSTNGTWVDNVKLGGVGADGGKSTDNQRALFAGSVIHLAPGPKLLRFIVRIPTQDGTRLASERVPSPAGGESSIANVGIDPGPSPPFPPPKRLPKTTRSPVRPLAADLRDPFKVHGKGRHTAKAVKYNEYEGWDGGERYKFEGIIGKGAFATVRRAIDRRTGDAYAVKSIQKRAFAQSSDRQLGVRKEVEILEKLNHPNIVSYIDCHEDRSHIYIFMELIKGGDLNEYLGRHGALPESMVQEVSRQVLRGIEYVHSMGISHRDLKPDNILLACDDPIQVKISDFGLAKMVQNEDTFLKTFCGTMLFLAPEVFPGYASALVEGAGSMKRKRNPREEAGREDGRGARQRRRYNQAVDMWSFGCVIFMLLTGSAPFQGKNQDDMLRIILSGRFDLTPLEKRLGAPSHLAKDFVGRLLQVNPGMRMMEVEALRHPWLADGSEEQSSMEVQEDDVDEGPNEEDGESNAISSFEKVEKQQEKWMMVQGPDARPKFTASSGRLGHEELSDNDEEDSDGEEIETSKHEELQDVQLRKAVTGLSFRGEIHIPAVRFDSGSSEGSFASLGDAESNRGSRRMFHPPPGISIQGSSGVFPDHGFSVFSDGNDSSENGRQVEEEFVPSSQMHEPFEYDELRVTKPGNGARSGSISRSVSGGSLSGAEAMVGKLKVHSPSPKDTPSPTDGEFQQHQNQMTLPAANEVMNGDIPTSPHPTPLPRPYPQTRTCLPPNPQTLITTTVNSPSQQPPRDSLIPMPDSIPHSTISLNRHQISIGRSANCTHTETDIRISKYHIAFQLSLPDCDVDKDNFQPANNMIAWYSVKGTNGVILNGKKKHKGRVGRIYDGDVVYLFKDCKPGGVVEYLGFRCEFSIGQHVRLVEEQSDYEDEGFGNAHGVATVSMATTMAVGTSKEENRSIDGVA
ncbi:Pkinase-domain-containing protein [Tuber magnatum]|uniref:Autophagy-related protein 1 n=1 Tax=Tuber magnatum TaxID=42249 RepID=A0A317SF77_9PEZI|nr:Pkinase-domain-containing protein [Tuber magnatum]